MRIFEKCIWVAMICISLILSGNILPASSQPVYPEKLSITYVASPLNIPTIIEKKQKRFEAAFPGTNILLPDLNAGPRQTAAMAAGEVDIAHCLGATSAILAASEGLDIRIVGVYSRAHRAFMVMTKNPDIKSILDLKGKKIGGPKGTILHQLIASATAKAGLGAKDYEFINMGISAAAAALSSGGIDAALLAGPDAYRAIQAGASVLIDGVGLVDATTVIATRQTYMDKNPGVMERFLKMHTGTLDFMKRNGEETIRLGAEGTGLPAEAVKAMLPWYDFSPAITSGDIEELKRTQDFMLENGLQRKRIDIESIVKR